MSQLTLQIPFKKKYLKREFYVSSNNFAAYELIENYPNWPGKCVNIFGPSGCGKTHLTKILSDKVNINLVDAKNYVVREKSLFSGQDYVFVQFE